MHAARAIFFNRITMAKISAVERTSQIQAGCQPDRERRTRAHDGVRSVEQLDPLPPWRNDCGGRKEKSTRDHERHAATRFRRRARGRRWSELVQRTVIASAEFYRDASAVVLYRVEAQRSLDRRDLRRRDRVGARGLLSARRTARRSQRKRSWPDGFAIARNLQRGAYGILEPPASAEVLDQQKFREILDLCSRRRLRTRRSAPGTWRGPL